MPTGYLVTLGDTTLDSGDAIAVTTTTFTETGLNGDGIIGSGSWTFNATRPNGSVITRTRNGQYYEATDGNVYFVPNSTPNPNLTLNFASAASAPSYTAADRVVEGTSAGETIDSGYTDGDGDQVDDGGGAGTGGLDDEVRGFDGDDTIDAGAGDDTIFGGQGSDSIAGGTGADVIYGDGDAPEASEEFLSWSAVGADESDLSGGFTQNTGDIDVTVSFSDDGNNNAEFTVESSDIEYVGAGEPMSTTSAGYLFGDGDADTATVTLDFDAATGANVTNEVRSVVFRVNDIDWFSGNHTDVITVNAYDADGNVVPVTITPGTGDNLSGNTITAGETSEDLDDEAGSALIEIAGPVHSVEVIYFNDQGGTHGVGITDVHFVTIPVTETLDDTIDGGQGNDIIYGDDGGEESAGTEFLDWTEAGADEADISGGFTQNTGDMDVTVSWTDDGNNNAEFTVESSDLEYVGPGEPMSTTSAGYMFGNGDADTSTATIDFAAASGAQVSDEVENVIFRVNDIDWAAGNHTDTVTVNAYDADGNLVPVTITPGTGDTVVGNTITAGETGEDLEDEAGSALIEIAGPVAKIEVIYFNGQGGTHGIGITDIHFDTISTVGGDDSIDGGAGDDQLYGEAGSDTLRGGTGQDTLSGGLDDDELRVSHDDIADGGSGDDVFVIEDLGETPGGTITIEGGESGETGGDTLRLGNLADMSTLSTTTDISGNGLTGSVSLLDGTVVNFSNIESIICFTPGTRILTETGNRPVQTLQVGDRIVTRDHGVQPLRWIGRRTVMGLGNLAPVRLLPAATGARRPLLVSPQHRMLLTGYRAGLLFGDDEVLAPAIHMLDGHTVRQVETPLVTYIHLMFDAHQVIYAEDAATESFFLSDQGLQSLSDAGRAMLFDSFPHLRANIAAYGQSARRTLRAHETALLLNRPSAAPTPSPEPQLAA